MSLRTSGLLLLAAVLLGAFVYLYELRGGGEQVEARSAGKRLFPGLVAADIERISISTRDGERAELERRVGGWELMAPVRFAADEVALEAIVSQLAQLDVEGRVAGSSTTLALSDFGLADPASELRFTAEGAERTLRIGSKTPVGGNTYVTTDAAQEVAFVATWRTNVLQKSLAELRDRRLLDFDHAAVRAVSVRWPHGGVELERRGEGWWLTRPIEERADQDTVETLLSDLAFLRADDFIDGVVNDGGGEDPLAELGLDAPQLQIVLAGEGGDGTRFERGLALGAVREGRLAARGGGGALYWVSPGRLEELPRVVVAYRFKQLARFEVSDARRFELWFSDEGGELRSLQGELAAGVWRTTPIAMAPGRVGGMLAELANLEGRDIVADALGEEELAALGLAPPRVRVRVFDATGAVLASLSIGVLQPERGLLAQRSDSPIIHRLDPELADQIPISFAALEQRFRATEPDDPLAPEVDVEESEVLETSP